MVPLRSAEAGDSRVGGTDAERLALALTAFGAPLGSLKILESDLTRPDTVVQFGSKLHSMAYAYHSSGAPTISEANAQAAASRTWPISNRLVPSNDGAAANRLYVALAGR